MASCLRFFYLLSAISPFIASWHFSLVHIIPQITKINIGIVKQSHSPKEILLNRTEHLLSNRHHETRAERMVTIQDHQAQTTGLRVH